nr:retrovirus-related Pol polyprotein from transposon TNT 1-94 [Tanacetum cinerariifolium]
MAAGSRDRPLMLAPGRYPQWRSRFLRYVDIRPNGEALRKFILSGPYKPTTVLVQAVEATDDFPAVLEHTTVKTLMNMSPENKAHFLAEKEAIHLILTVIGDDIYSTVDACQTVQEMWEAIERKPKRVKDSAYHKEKMLLCKQAEQVETYDSNVTLDSLDMCEDDIQNEQNDVGSDDERVALGNLIANLKLDVDENKKIQKQLKKSNTSLAQELKECKAILAETSKSLRESISLRDCCLVALQTKHAEFKKFKVFNDRTIDYDKLKHKLNEAQGQLAHKDTVIREGLKTKAYELLVVKEKHDELMKQSLLTKSHYEGLVKQKTKVITNLKLREEHNIKKMLSMKKQLKFLNEVVYKRSQSIQTIHVMAPKQEMHAVLKYVESLEKEINELESDKAEFSNMYEEILKLTCFVRDLQGNDLLISNRGSYLYTISLQESTSSTPLYLMAKATPTQAWLWHRRLSHLNFDYINLLSNKDIMIGLPKLKYVKDQLCSSCELSKAKRSSFKSKVVPSSKGRLNLLHMDLCGPMRVASINGKKYILVIVNDYLRYMWTLFLPDADVSSQQELDLLFGPLYDEFFNVGSNPSTNIQSTSAPSTHTNVYAEENNNNQPEEGEHLQDDEFTNPFYAPAQEEAESSSHNIADMFTKALPEDTFKYIVRRIGMRCLTPAELEVLAKESA